MKTIKQQLEALLEEADSHAGMGDMEALESVQYKAMRLLIDKLKKTDFREKELVILVDKILHITMKCFCGEPAVCQECEHCSSHCSCVDEDLDLDL